MAMQVGILCLKQGVPAVALESCWGLSDTHSGDALTDVKLWFMCPALTDGHADCAAGS